MEKWIYTGYFQTEEEENNYFKSEKFKIFTGSIKRNDRIYFADNEWKIDFTHRELNTK